MFDRLEKSPNTCSSQSTTIITTMVFKMDLMVDCIGIKFTSQSKTPTTTNVSNTCNNGVPTTSGATNTPMYDTVTFFLVGFLMDT